MCIRDRYTELEIIDVLPHIGDTSLLTTSAPRDSDWSLELTAPISMERFDPATGTWSPVPAADISSGPFYSTSTTPCYDDGFGEVHLAGMTSPAGCTIDLTTSADPAPGARSFGLIYTPSTPLMPGEFVRVVVPFQQLAGEPDGSAGDIAWNLSLIHI